MEELILSRAEFLWLEQPKNSVRMCVDRAVNELIHNDGEYFRDTCTLYDISVNDAKDDYINSLTNKLIKKVNYCA